MQRNNLFFSYDDVSREEFQRFPALKTRVLRVIQRRLEKQLWQAWKNRSCSTFLQLFIFCVSTFFVVSRKWLTKILSSLVDSSSSCISSFFQLTFHIRFLTSPTTRELLKILQCCMKILRANIFQCGELEIVLKNACINTFLVPGYL